MNTKAFKAGLLALALSTSSLAFSQTGDINRMQSQGMMHNTMMSTAEVNSLIATWPMASQKAAKEIMDQYGAPNEATPTMLMWHHNGPWKHTMVYKEEIQHNFPKAHADVLEQVIDYKVSPDKFDDLAAFDGSVIVERTKGEISARCDKEANNILALNLANDIVTGRKTVQEARAEYAQNVMAALQGHPMIYTQALQFNVPRMSQADPDMPFMPSSVATGMQGMQSQDMSQDSMMQNSNNPMIQSMPTTQQSQMNMPAQQQEPGMTTERQGTVRGFW